MKNYLLLILLWIVSLQLHAQNECNFNHRLFRFQKGQNFQTLHHFPIIVQRLGKGKQFYPLHGISSLDTFLFNLKHAYIWRMDEKREMNSLLKAINFKDGITSHELTIDKIKKVIIPFNSIGNLGGIRNKHGKRQMEYIYAKLHIKKEKDGISAWKITGPTGCYFYVLKGCGNAFYPNQIDSCCHTVNIKPTLDTVIQQHIIPQKSKITICVYQVINYTNSSKNWPLQQQSQQKQSQQNTGFAKTTCKTDTILLNCDTALITNDVSDTQYRIYMDSLSYNYKICGDKSVIMKNRITLTPIKTTSFSERITKDTLKFYIPVFRKCETISPCSTKFEFGINGGFSYNTVPSITNDIIHTRATSAHFAGNMYFGYLINPIFQIGMDVGYLNLVYSDDVLYPRPAGIYQNYNEVYLAKPVIPLQLFGKIIMGTSKIASNLSFSVGYSFVSNSKIVNNGTEMSANPNVTGGLVAGLGLGVDYFFNCHFGVGLGIKANYFSLKGSQQTYNLWAFPTTAGIRYRF